LAKQVKTSKISFGHLALKKPKELKKRQYLNIWPQKANLALLT